MAYRYPVPAVDVIIEMDGGIVLIARKNPPYGWALPGGFVNAGESCETAAVREAHEETSLHVQLHALLHVYSDPRRDPRHHVMTTVYVGTSSGTPVGQDDAREARVFPLDDLPRDIAFDHGQIIADYRRFADTGVRPLG